MNTAQTQKTQTHEEILAEAKSFLSPEALVSLEQSKVEVSERIAKLSNPLGVTLTSLKLATIIGQAISAGLIVSEEIDEVLSIVGVSSKMSNKLATEASAGYVAQQITQAGQASEA